MFEDGPKYLKAFLQSLIVNPFWDISFKAEVIAKASPKFVADGITPCYCPLHNRFIAYYKAVGTFATYSDFGMQCTFRCNGVFSNHVGLRAHLNDVGSWHHKLIKYFIMELYDPKPDIYDQRIVPDKNDKEKRDQMKDSVEDKCKPTYENKEEHEVVG